MCESLSSRDRKVFHLSPSSGTILLSVPNDTALFILQAATPEQYRKYLHTETNTDKTEQKVSRWDP